jgi:IS1 family transposase
MFTLEDVDMNRLNLQDRARIVGCLIEGNSLRSTTRLVGCSINTVTKLLVDLGTACDLYQNEKLRGLTCKRIQCDEIWSFVGQKEKTLPKEQRGRSDAGDIWTWTAIDADTKLMVSWLIGKRNPDCAKIFIRDLAKRIVHRVQLTTDGYKPYLTAVERSFVGNIDYAMLVKLYGSTGTNSPDTKYSQGECCGAIKGTVCGNPDDEHISTSFVERQNLTMRMSMRRFTRLTNGFSKKVQNHACAVGLHYMYYNFGRIHKTLRVTPAMEAGISDHVWTLEEIAQLAE